MIEADKALPVAAAAVKMTERNLRNFWAKVDKDGPDHPYTPSDGKCWMWTGCRDRDGYGKFVTTPQKNQKQYWRANRLILLLTGTNIPKDMESCHSCNNPSCVNPGHITADTHRVNQDYKEKTDRIPRGERCSYSKLNDNLVRQIRLDYANGRTLTDLRNDYQMSLTLIYNVVNRLRWKHVA